MSQLNDYLISRSSTPSNLDFQRGCVFLVDKPMGWTSFDVVNKIRFTLKYALNVKKIKVGHAGTLDPLATGLLLVCAGKFTKRINEWQGLDKTYTGSITLGFTTATYDSEVPPDGTYPIDHITNDFILATAKRMVGQQLQMPPIYSAIKVKGQTAYSLARRGQKVELKPRPIIIHEFEINDIANNVLSFTISCSKGTYIRSIAHDLGKALGSGAYLSSLKRTKIGDFDVKDALSIEDITKIIDMLASDNKGV